MFLVIFFSKKNTILELHSGVSCDFPQQELRHQILMDTSLLLIRRFLFSLGILVIFFRKCYQHIMPSKYYFPKAHLIATRFPFQFLKLGSWHEPNRITTSSSINTYSYLRYTAHCSTTPTFRIDIEHSPRLLPKLDQSTTDIFNLLEE
jgi:hypothetical protein